MPVLTGRGSTRESNSATVGIIGLAVLALAASVMFNLGDIKRFLADSSYQADFAHASGLGSGDPVQVSGLTVGSVEKVRIEGTHVTVTFNADGVALGSNTRAAIKTASAIGGRYLALTPAGSGNLDRVPQSRTSVPYDLTSALGDLSDNTAELDVDQLAEAMNAVSESLKDTPENFRGTIEGIHKLSAVVASRDEALEELLADASSVSSVLADRSETITSLMSKGNEILSELVARRATIHALLVSTREISAEVSGTVKDNRKQLKPALDQLDQVVAVLRRNEKSINFLIDHVGGYTRNLGEAVGGGPFFYGFVQNLVPTNLIPVPISSQPEGAEAG